MDLVSCSCRLSLHTRDDTAKVDHSLACCMALATTAPSFTCVRICETSYDVTGPVADKYMSANQAAHIHSYLST
jgi:hypothetical protein